MHMLGKRHTRMTHLHRQRMVGAAAASVAEAVPASLQQQQHQLLMAAAAAATLSSGAAAWVPSSSSGLASGADLLDSPSPLASPALGAAGTLGPSSLAGLPTGDGEGGVGGAVDGAVALQGLLLDASGNQRIYRCDLCGVVTPSRRHYDYHLQVAGAGLPGRGRRRRALSCPLPARMLTQSISCSLFLVAGQASGGLSAAALALPQQHELGSSSLPACLPAGHQAHPACHAGPGAGAREHLPAGNPRQLRQPADGQPQQQPQPRPARPTLAARQR